MDQQTGKYMMAAAAILFLIGLLVYFGHDRLHWIGRLPGDIRVERPDFKLYLPLTSMLLFSLLLSLVVAVFRKFF